MTILFCCVAAAAVVVAVVVAVVDGLEVDFLPKSDPNNDFFWEEAGVGVGGAEGAVCACLSACVLDDVVVVVLEGVGGMRIGFLLLDTEDEEDLSFFDTGVIETCPDEMRLLLGVLSDCKAAFETEMDLDLVLLSFCLLILVGKVLDFLVLLDLPLYSQSNGMSKSSGPQWVGWLFIFAVYGCGCRVLCSQVYQVILPMNYLKLSAVFI